MLAVIISACNNHHAVAVRVTTELRTKYDRGETAVRFDITLLNSQNREQEANHKAALRTHSRAASWKPKGSHPQPMR